MSEENKKKLNEQLVRCVLDDKLSNDKKIRKIDYIVKLSGDINAECGLGYSLLSLAKMMQNDELVNFLEEKGAKDTDFDSEKAEKFFKTASVAEMNDVLKVLPDDYILMCDVDLRGRGLPELPNFSKIIAGGKFFCGSNNLETLKGAPKIVMEEFNCFACGLVSLKGGPKLVGRDYVVMYNNLTSLEGAPIKCGGDFICSINKLTTLKGAPIDVGGCFNCAGNKLEILEYAPKKVNGMVDCSNNELISLKGVTRVVGGDFDCSNNDKIESLEGAPDKVYGDFNCSKCKMLKSLKGKPEFIEGEFIGNDMNNVIVNSYSR